MVDGGWRLIPTAQLGLRQVEDEERRPFRGLDDFCGRRKGP
jgi:hypothetical protein